jgi:hypothetical protein
MDAPVVEVGKNKLLFRRIIKNWLAEPQGRRVARAAFEDILRDKGTLRLSQHLELVTIIELLGKTKSSSPLTKGKAREVIAALQKALKEYASRDPKSASWINALCSRVNNINYHNAAVVVQIFLDDLPPGFISFTPTFPSDVIKLRNTLTHSLGDVKNSDLNRLAFFIAKLKTAIALSDVVSLGASSGDVRKDADLIMRANSGSSATVRRFSSDRALAARSSRNNATSRQMLEGRRPAAGAPAANLRIALQSL